MNRTRKTMLTGLFLLFALLPLTAREVTDTACVSRFMAGDDTYYVPYACNDTGLSRPEKCVMDTMAQDAAKEYTLSLRADLLRWATLTPDLGLEWRVSRSLGILVNGSWTSWSWNDSDRRYALWEVTPEVRWYLGETKCGYIGAMCKTGQFNCKLSSTGRQGGLTGGGISGGYQLRLNNSLSMDFNVGIGCLHAEYDKYTVTGGVRVRGGKESKNWWGPVNAGVTLVWRIY